MKILHVTNYFKLSWESGGVTRVVYEFARACVANGNEVTVLITDGCKKQFKVRRELYNVS